MENIGVIIQARMGSTRLYGKVMKKILHNTVLGLVVDRVSKSSYVTEVTVATTDNEEDDIIYSYCKEKGINVFRGLSEDVLDRYYKCAKEFQYNNIVRITSDCPLHDSKVIDKVIENYLSCNCDYASNTLEDYTYPDGLDVEVFSFKSLKDAWENAKLYSEREHVTPYIKKNKQLNKVNVKAESKYPEYRLTLDCQEDYEVIKAIYEGIGKQCFSLDEIIAFLDNNPEIAKINNMYKPNEGYIKSLKEDRYI